MPIERLSKLVEPYPFTAETVKAWINNGVHPELVNAIFKDPKTGRWYGYPDIFHAYFQQHKTGNDFRETIRGVFGVHLQPEIEAICNAEIDILKIITGIEPSPFWTNAKFIKGDLTKKVAVAFGVTTTVPWEIIVEQTQAILKMPHLKQATFFKSANERLAAISDEVLS